MEIIKEQLADYLKGGMCCPSCACGVVDRDFTPIGGLDSFCMDDKPTLIGCILVMTVVCKDCGGKWSEHYRLYEVGEFIAKEED